MQYTEKARILLIMPRELLDAADEVAKKLQISRLGFIRQCIAKNIACFHRNDRKWFDFSTDAIWRRREHN